MFSPTGSKKNKQTFSAQLWLVVHDFTVSQLTILGSVHNVAVDRLPLFDFLPSSRGH